MSFFRRKSGALSGTGKVDLNTYIAPPRAPDPEQPPRPLMTPPRDGTMSVAIEKTHNAVWIWILLTETTKQTLAMVLKEPVDQYPKDMDQARLRYDEFIRDIDNIWANNDKNTRAMYHDKYALEGKKLYLTPSYIFLREMLKSPFRYDVKSAQEAADYVERLKTNVLPKIKSMIEAQSRPSTEQFEL